jgi:hypothetical protein
VGIHCLTTAIHDSIVTVQTSRISAHFEMVTYVCRQFVITRKCTCPQEKATLY